MENEEEHMDKVKKVLQRLRENGLYVKVEKCEFMKKEVDYLGMVISGEGVKMKDGKVKAVTEWKEPTCTSLLWICQLLPTVYLRLLKRSQASYQPSQKEPEMGIGTKSTTSVQQLEISVYHSIHINPPRPNKTIPIGDRCI